jgi:hypothetical protein
MNFDGKSIKCEKVRLYYFVQIVRVFYPINNESSG